MTHELNAATNAGLIDIQIEYWAVADLVLIRATRDSIPSVRSISSLILSGSLVS